MVVYPPNWSLRYEIEAVSNQYKFTLSFSSENIFTCRIIYPMDAIDINASQYFDLSVHNLGYQSRQR